MNKFNLLFVLLCGISSLHLQASSEINKNSSEIEKNETKTGKRSINTLLDTIANLDIETFKQFSQMPSPLSSLDTPPTYDNNDEEEEEEDYRREPEQEDSNFDNYDTRDGKSSHGRGIKQYWAGDKENFDDDSDSSNYPVSPYPPFSYRKNLLDSFGGFSPQIGESFREKDLEATSEGSGYHDNAYYPSERKSNINDNTFTTPTQESTPFYPSYGVPTPPPHKKKNNSPKELRLPLYSQNRKPNNSIPPHNKKNKNIGSKRLSEIPQNNYLRSSKKAVERYLRPLPAESSRKVNEKEDEESVPKDVRHFIGDVPSLYSREREGQYERFRYASRPSTPDPGEDYGETLLPQREAQPLNQEFLKGYGYRYGNPNSFNSHLMDYDHNLSNSAALQALGELNIPSTMSSNFPSLNNGLNSVHFSPPTSSLYDGLAGYGLGLGALNSFSSAFNDF